MKKHLAIEVTNKYESEIVQKVLFDMGFDWNSSIDMGRIYEVKHTDYVLIVCRSDDKSLNGSNCPSKKVSFYEFLIHYAGHIEKFPDYEFESKDEQQNYEQEYKSCLRNHLAFNENKPMTNKIDNIRFHTRPLPATSDKSYEVAILSDENVAITNKINEIIDVIDTMNNKLKLIDECSRFHHSMFEQRIARLEKNIINNFYSSTQQSIEEQINAMEKNKWYLISNAKDYSAVIQLIDLKDNCLFCHHIFILKSDHWNIGESESKYMDISFIKSIQKLDIE